MIALTTRLNERDETIIQLQEELDAYDRLAGISFNYFDSYKIGSIERPRTCSNKGTRLLNR